MIWCCWTPNAFIICKSIFLSLLFRHLFPSEFTDDAFFHSIGKKNNKLLLMILKNVRISVFVEKSDNRQKIFFFRGQTGQFVDTCYSVPMKMCFNIHKPRCPIQFIFAFRFIKCAYRGSRLMAQKCSIWDEIETWISKNSVDSTECWMIRKMPIKIFFSLQLIIIGPSIEIRTEYQKKKINFLFNLHEISDNYFWQNKKKITHIPNIKIFCSFNLLKPNPFL